MTLPAELVSQFERLLDVEIARMDDDFAHEKNRVAYEATKRGALQSSSTALGLARVASNSLSVRAQTILTLLFRCMGAHRLALAGEAENVKHLISERLGREEAKLRDDVLKHGIFRTSSLQASADGFLRSLTQTLEQERQRLGAEIDLAASAECARAEENVGSPHSYVFNAPVGMVQTGPGSFGVSHQHIDEGSRAVIKDALAKIEALLDKDDDHDRELAEMIVEGRQELDKPKPSMPRLRGLIQGLGGAILYAPKLRAAYDTLKWAGAFVGVTLP